MKSLTVLFYLILIIFTGCNTFEGVAGDPGETYTTTYNTPGLRIVPYNNQHVDVNEPVQEIEICEGLIKGNQMPKCER